MSRQSMITDEVYKELKQKKEELSKELGLNLSFTDTIILLLRKRPKSFKF